MRTLNAKDLAITAHASATRRGISVPRRLREQDARLVIGFCKRERNGASMRLRRGNAVVIHLGTEA